MTAWFPISVILAGIFKVSMDFIELEYNYDYEKFEPFLASGAILLLGYSVLVDLMNFKVGLRDFRLFKTKKSI